MNIGSKVRVKNEPHIVFRINREQFGNFGRPVETRGARTGMVMPLTVWYSPDQLEEIE